MKGPADGRAGRRKGRPMDGPANGRAARWTGRRSGTDGPKDWPTVGWTVGQADG